MQYMDPGNTQMRLPPLYRGPTFMTLHQSCASVQNSSLITPPSATAALASSSIPNNSKKFRSEAADSQSTGNVPLGQDSGASASSKVQADGIIRHRNKMVGMSNAIKEIGFLPEGLYSDTSPQVTSSPSLTRTMQELNLLGNSSEISNQVSTSYDHASPVITSSYASQQSHRFQVNQLVDQQNARSIQLKKNQHLLLMYHHAMVCRKKEDCGLPMCAKLKKTLEHAVHCDGVNCTRYCLFTQNAIKHFKSCYDPRCALCGPVKEIISKRGAKIDNEESERHDSVASDEPGLKRVRTDQQNARSIQLKKNQHLLLMYHHTMVCRKKEDCGLPMCAKLKKTLEHAVHCDSVNCTRYCLFTQNVIKHFKSCYDPRCALCGPVKEIISKRGAKIDNEESKRHDSLASDEPGPKRVRIDDSYGKLSDASSDLKKENEVNVVSDEKSGNGLRAESVSDMELGCSVNEVAKEPKVKSVNASDHEDGIEPVEHLKDSDPLNNILEDGRKVGLVINADSCSNETAEVTTKIRFRGASLLDTFTPENINIHLSSLRLCEKKTQATTEQLEPLDEVQDQNTCSLCGMEELLFAPPPRYCGKCNVLIASHGVYYCTGETGDKNKTFPSSVPISLCCRCYNVSGELIKLPSGDVSKMCFEKRSNYAETDANSEWWVQCSKCESWQHQICALFNGRRNQSNVEYTCVTCFLKEIENGKCESLAPIKVFGACDLPRTMLSDHIEKWLFTHLEIEREERATNLGKKVEEVPGVEGLCVRVVSSVDRVAYVNRNFKEFLKDENYPSQFPYKSKAIVLFQKIEGVEVCLFAMYVQEYGSQCPLPNQRHTYISYIDSVKYFQPEIKSSTGEALRTFVFHGILIAYLDYCKKRGFASCSLWACPPTKHDDYILYCHPASQKMPKAEKLRGWYQAMIAKALKEKVVVERTNLYDYYLIPTNNWKTSVSAAHLPYCDNDFWPGEAEFILSNKDKSGPQKKETQPKGRAMRAAKRGLMDGKPDDIMFLHKLGERMRSIKEDFILIHLQPTCKHCRRGIISGTRWVCKSCKNFLLCDQCYGEEEEFLPKDKHPASSKLKHEFQKVNELALPATDDPDPCIDCEFFDSRIDLLSLCQKEMYQFDTLRRAKHSTMMILYHLHTRSCSTCHAELEPDEISWRCPTCPGYYMCSSCYRRGVWEFAHDHELVRLYETVTGTGTNTHIGNAKGNTKITIKQPALETLLHASQCIRPRCEHKQCRKLKMLFRHGVLCKVRQSGGCLMCKKVWYLMQLHCSSCQDLNCKVDRCREIKDHINKLRLHSGS